METDDNNKNCSCAAILNRLKEAEQEIERIKQMPAGKGGSRTKRAPSKYNIFIGECTKGGKKSMVECAAEYKKTK